MKRNARSTATVSLRLVMLVMLGLLGLLFAGHTGGRSAHHALRADLEAILDDAVASGSTVGVAIHVSSPNGDSGSLAAGVGETASEWGVPMPPTATFRAGSILKTFVATAVLQAVEAGRLALGDVLTARLPAVVTARVAHADMIDVRMLLGHRSGIPEWVDTEVKQRAAADPSHVWTLDEILARASRLPAAPPGERYEYSNTNYTLLGEILSHAYGKPWRDVVRDQVFARAGLEQTTLPNVGELACPPPCAHGYLRQGGGRLDVTRLDPSMAGAAGGHALVTSPSDLNRFFQRLRGGALFDRPGTVDAMLTFPPAPDPQTRQIGYGLGVMRVSSNGNLAIGHLGGTAGYQSFMLHVPATDRYVSGFINVTGDLGSVLEPILARVAKP